MSAKPNPRVTVTLAARQWMVILAQLNEFVGIIVEPLLQQRAATSDGNGHEPGKPDEDADARTVENCVFAGAVLAQKRIGEALARKAPAQSISSATCTARVMADAFLDEERPRLKRLEGIPPPDVTLRASIEACEATLSTSEACLRTLQLAAEVHLRREQPTEEWRTRAKILSARCMASEARLARMRKTLDRLYGLMH